jgi:hypothetical protein
MSSRADGSMANACRKYHSGHTIRMAPPSQSVAPMVRNNGTGVGSTHSGCNVVAIRKTTGMRKVAVYATMRAGHDRFARTAGPRIKNTAATATSKSTGNSTAGPAVVIPVSSQTADPRYHAAPTQSLQARRAMLTHDETIASSRRAPGVVPAISLKVSSRRPMTSSSNGWGVFNAGSMRIVCALE